MTRAFAALVLSASAAASAMPTAVERGGVVPGGQFQRTIVLDQTLRTEGGDTLLRGSYEVRFESLPGNKVRATFFQGGVKRGEAQGIIIGGTPASLGFSSRLMEHEGISYYFKHAEGKHQLVVGQQGATQIQISLLPPAVAPAATPAITPARKAR
jgi:hypothetical protein